MGLIDVLFTGASIVGKICQGITSVLGSNAIVSDDGHTKVYEANLNVGGGEFYLSNEETATDKYLPYIHNPGTLPLSVCLPDIDGVGGIEFLVIPMKSREITNLIVPNIPADTEVLIGPVCDTDVVDNEAGREDTAIKLCLNSLPLDGTPVMLGGYTISADCASNTLKVQSLESAVGAITYFGGVSEDGVVGELNNVVCANDANAPIKIGCERTYHLDFSSMGFEPSDKLRCRLYLSSADGNAARIAAHAKFCRPLPEFYRAWRESVAKKR